MTNNIKLPPIPKPHTPPVFATAANTPSVKAGYELGGYEKTPPLFDEHQLEAYAREAVRLNAQEAPFKEALAAGDFYPQVHGYGSEVQTQVATGTQEAPAQPLTVPDAQEKDLLQAIQERDAADDYIDALLDEVLGTDRPEWSSAYGHADAIEQVRERINTLMKPSIDKAWDRFQSSVAPQPAQPAEQQGDALVTMPDGIERMAVNRYRPVPSGVLAYKVVGGDGYRSLFFGTKDECQIVARKLTEAFLDGAHAALAAQAQEAAPAAPAAPQPAQPAQHPDDEAVDTFSAAMKQKLAQAREKGRGGWETCPPEELSRMLREHVEKGDPRDVANFCMFLWSLGHGITAPQPAQPLDLGVMELAESVGLIGPASRTHDLHGAIQRFHDLIVVNASIKAALHFADGLAQPAQQPLTDEQAASLAKQLGWDTMPERFPLIVRAVEQAHRIGVKNEH